MQTRSRRRAVAISALGAAALIGVTVHADYNGVSIEKHTTVSITGQSYDVWRLYANFTNAGDRLVAGFAGEPPQYAPINIETRNFNDTAAGNAFFTVGGVVSAPTQSQINSNAAAQWASFVTIGVPIADLAPEGDQIILTPGFLPVGGNVWTHSDLLWFVPPTIPDAGGSPPLQSVAGWAGDGDAALRVMMLQLTVRAGENIRGTVNLDWFNPIGSGGGNVVIHQGFATFNTFTIPAPGALGLLGVVALLGRRRHRGRGTRRV